MSDRPTPETDDVAQLSSLLQYETVNANFARKLERERDELRQWKKEMLLIESQWDEQIVGRLLGLQLGDYIKANIEPKLRQLIRERDEARAKLSRKQQTLTIAEGTISDLRKQRDEWSAMCSRYKQERDIAEQDATNYHARIIELIAERDKTKQERDEAREKYDQICSQTLIEINKVCDERDKLREALRDVLKVSEPTPVMTYQKMEDIASKALKDTAK